MKYDEAKESLLEVMRKDYAAFTLKCSFNEKTFKEAYAETEGMFVIESGRSYDKIVKVDNAQRSCCGFICRKDNPKKGYVVGDMLKAASWCSPATNFVRGNIMNGQFERVRWTGIY
jgi:hypothetical protein